jgi:Clp amino terminal domain, pathogenicity island component
MVSGIRVDQLAAAVDERAAGHDAVLRLTAAVEVADDVRGVADELLDRYVAAAREDGRSWAEIGAALGVSKQAAQQRFVAPPVDPTAWPKDFDEDARAVVHAAQAHARSLRHRYLGTEHLLLALTADSGLAGATLGQLGVNTARVAAAIRKVVGEGHSSETATLGISPRTKRVLEAAGIEARRLGHRCAIAAPEHMLLALSAASDSVAAQLLRDLGVSEERLRDQLGDLLAGEAPELADMIRQPPRRRLRRRPRRRPAA